MQRVSDLAQQLAAAVVAADPDDLQALAMMHSQFQEIAQAISDMDTEQQFALSSIKDAAGAAEQVVEQIILRESDNAMDELKKVEATIAEIQRAVEAALNGSPATVAMPSAPAPAEPTIEELAAADLEAPAPVESEPSASPAAAATPAPAAPAAAAAADEDDHPLEITQETVLGPDDVPLAQEFVNEAQGHLESAEAGILKLEEDPGDRETIAAIFRAFHTIKGVAGFLNLKQIGALAHAGENLLDLARQGQMNLTGPKVDLILEALDLTKVLVSEIERATKSGTPIPLEPRLPALLKKLHDCAAGKDFGGEPEPAAGAGDSAAAGESHPDSPAATPAAEHAPEAKSASASSQHGHSEQTVKVATDRLDALINMVGELVIAQAMVSQDTAQFIEENQKLGRNMAHLSKITRELQDLSMSMRMVPIQGVFQKMARLVRDTARKIGKEIDFVMAGGETELDRNVVEAIADPLVHMVRNSVDHGVESPEERIKAGKPRAGRVELKAYHQAGNIVIEITDDGRGLNKQKILDKAIRVGLVKEGQQMEDAEIFRLIFASGLSTAEKVTDISGRGVGMDVVRKNVEALRGRIDITSTPGKGSTFTIRLPLTLAVIDGLVVKVGAERYIIPITSIEQSIQPRPEQLSTVQNRGEMCMVRGKLLPVLRLYKLFKVQPKTDDPTKALVVIVQNDQGERCCLLVDELLGQQQVVIKSLGEGMGHVRGISGGAILGDGNVSLILDVPGLIDMSAGK